jgi:hypothetical protein
MIYDRFTLIEAIVSAVIALLLIAMCFGISNAPAEHSFITVDGQVIHDPDCMHYRCWD